MGKILSINSLILLALLSLPACDTVEEEPELNGSKIYEGSMLNGDLLPYINEAESNENCDSWRMKGWLTIFDNGTYEMQSREVFTICRDPESRGGHGQLHYGTWTESENIISFHSEDIGSDFTARRQAESDRFIIVYFENDTLSMEQITLGLLEENRSITEESIIQKSLSQTRYDN